MMRKAIIGLMLVSVVAGCNGQTPSQTPAQVLPLKTVRLYETGVAYFERTGTADPEVGTSLPVPAGHLDDALKTLVVLGEGGQSSVGGLEFESSMSEGMARALAGLSKEAGTPISHFELLSSLKGDEVRVTTKRGAFEGRVIDVLQEPTKKQEDRDEQGGERVEAAPELVLLILTKTQEIRRFKSEDIEAVRPTSPVTAARLGLALNTLSTRAAQTRRMLRVMAKSQGPVTLGYIAEAPIWRTTYRVVLDETGEKSVLQGWALLHNDTDEDWRRVRVQLVNGQPDSFLFPLAAPRYARRDLATPSQELSTIPQLLDKTPDAIWGDHAETGEGIGLGSIGTIRHGRGSGIGYGSGSGSFGYSTSTVSRSDLLEIGNLASIVQAEGIESGALFTYTLPQLLSLRAHGSALVPFIQSAVEAKRITWVGASEDARMGVHFVNSTNQTLPPGPIAFFADGGFSGESALERLKPRERRYIHFGMDIDMETSQRTVTSSEESRRLVYREKHLVEHYVKKDKVLFKMENRSGLPREVHWALSVVNNAKVDGPDKVTFDVARNQPVAIFEMPARKEMEREVRMEQGLSRSHLIALVDVALLERLAQSTSLPEDQKKVVVDAVKRLAVVEETRQRISRNDKARGVVEADLNRLREHLKALGGEVGGVAANPFVRRILEAEDRLVVLRAEMQKLVEEEEARFEEFEEVLERLRPADGS